MADSRRPRRRNGTPLTLIAGGRQPGTGHPDGAQPGSGPPATDPRAGAGWRTGAHPLEGVSSDVAADEPDLISLAGVRELMEALGAPSEMLETVDGASDLDDAFEQLTASGLIPEPQDMLDGVIDSFGSLLEPGCDPLSAELAGAEFLGLMRKLAPTDADMLELLVVMVREAAGRGTPAALAMVRVVAAGGPAELRSELDKAAGQLLAAGVTDPAWVTGLGAPKPGPAFGYGDPLSEQESIAITFAYGRMRHGIVVLIDHALGGGVKDCFFSGEPNRIRSSYRSAAREAGLEFREYQPAEARAILERALSESPCPAEPDQAMDIDLYLGLLRSRVALLPAGGTHSRPDAGVLPGMPALLRTNAQPGRSGTAGQRPKAAATQSVHRLKITLRGSKPPIWRRLEVPSGIALQRLHATIQQAFGWLDCHLWVFSTPAGEYGVRDPELGHHSAQQKKLSAVAPLPGDRVTYVYDFGDDWEHLIAVEAVLPAEPGVAYPRCITGRRACPPEDCGGIWGYEDLLVILADPGHEEHTSRLEWLGLESAADFDPAGFDVAAVNDALKPLARVLRKP